MRGRRAWLTRRSNPNVGDSDFERATFLTTRGADKVGRIVEASGGVTNDGDTRLAMEGERLWLVRRGVLKSNGKSPAIEEKDFRRRFRPLVGVLTPQMQEDPSAWYRVAVLNGSHTARSPSKPRTSCGGSLWSARSPRKSLYQMIRPRRGRRERKGGDAEPHEGADAALLDAGP